MDKKDSVEAPKNSVKSPADIALLQAHVSSELVRYSSIRDHKETMAYAGIALVVGAAATALASKEWPPDYLKGKPWLIALGFTTLWGFALAYLRYQLRRRRWAALRVSGCDWLLAEWLPGSPHAMARDKAPAPRKPPLYLLLIDYVVWPIKGAVATVKPDPQVYPQEIVDAWTRAERRGTDAIIHERVIHLAGWIAYGAVMARTFLDVQGK